MIELLAIPGWQTPPTTLEAWISCLANAAGGPVEVEREGPQGSWIEIPSHRLRGFAILAGPHVEAVDFELHDPDPSTATRLLKTASLAIGWELHADEYEEEDDEDNE